VPASTPSAGANLHTIIGFEKCVCCFLNVNYQSVTNLIVWECPALMAAASFFQSFQPLKAGSFEKRYSGQREQLQNKKATKLSNHGIINCHY
jgi:hypothetical protein